MKTRTKLWILTVALLVGVVAVLVGIKAGQIGTMIKAGKSFAPPPETISTARVERSEWDSSVSAIGTLVAVRGVVVGAELAGTVREIGFESGASVKKGSVLVKLDTSTEEAQLAAAKADAVLAKLTLQRTRSLRGNGVTTAAELEAAEARAAQAQASVANLQAVIAKKIIRAPFDGRVAIRQVELGQVLSSGAAVASLHSVTPIYVEFTLPQQSLSTLKVGQRTRVEADIFPGAHWDGEISTINTEIDPSTRNVRIRAILPNPDGRLRPGMFVNVSVAAGGHRPVTIVPATAVLFAPYGDSVFAVEKKAGDGPSQANGASAPSGDTAPKAPNGAAGTAATDGPKVVRQKFVRLGDRRGDFVEVVSGVEPGEVIASSGAFKLRNGMSVVVNNSLAPQAELNPKPAE
jgi:membrane fusion protein (multidrug efflux system)